MDFAKDFLKEQGIDKEMINENQAFDQQKYINGYNKEHYKRVTVLVPKEEEDILSFLKGKKPVSTYILDLVREDMKKNHTK